MPRKTLEKIFALADKERANRITISKQVNDLTCAFELPGKEESYFKLPKKLESDLTDNLRRLLKIAPQDLTRGKYCKLRSNKYKLNFRVSILPEKYGEKIVISLIKQVSSLLRLNKLGLQNDEKKQIESALTKKGGLILITSHERGGRSTTLFSLLEKINRREKLVYFMGLYPEFDLEDLITLKNNTENWEMALRHDSDIIAVDDSSTNDLKLAVKAAATGRLVIATIEAINVMEALYKILNLGLPWNLVLDNLNLVTAQSLAKLKRGDKNKTRKQIGLFEVLKPDKKLISFLKNHQAKVQTKAFWEKAYLLAKETKYRPLINDVKQKEKEDII